MQKNKDGFTLIEVLVTAAITVILAIGILSLQYIIGQNQLTAWKNYLSINDSNLSISMIVRELRTARYGENGAYPLERATSNELIFYSDADYDNVVERVRYTLTGTTFVRGITEPLGFPATYPSENEITKTITDIARNNTEPMFYYYDNNWPEDTTNNPLATPVSPINVKLIRIYLKVNPSPEDSEKDYVLENFTQIRMLKENI